MAIGEANGKSSTFTIKLQSATQTHCAGPLCSHRTILSKKKSNEANFMTIKSARKRDMAISLNISNSSSLLRLPKELVTMNTACK